MSKMNSLRGMNDFLPPEIHLWQHIESSLRAVSHRFGFEEVRTPILESTSVFKRGVGEDTDIVEKEMYSFEDKGGEHVTMRPEGTAPVARALIEQSWFRAHPVSKFYYIGPMFRYERPQKGRFRQFHQFGIELLGIAEWTADVEVMALTDAVLKEFGLSKVELHLNSVGCDSESCRPRYRKLLIEKLKTVESELPEDARNRIQKNPQRLFDHKDEKVQSLMKGMPVLLDHICQDCKSHFNGVQSGLKNLGIDFMINPNIVRGLDYYNRTAFEFLSSDLGAQSTVCGGGRYDKLIEQFGGPSVPAVGFGMGLERLVLIIQALGKLKVEFKSDVSVIYADDEGFMRAQLLCHELRLQGIHVDMDLQGKNIKNQFKRADKVGSKVSLVLGSQEISQKQVVLKDMKTQQQKNIPLDQIVNEINKLKV